MKLSVAFQFLFALPVLAASSLRAASVLEDHDGHLAVRHIEGLGDVPIQLLDGSNGEERSLKKKKKKKGKKGKKECYKDCQPEDVNLAEYPQWQEEEGYWIGEYTFYQADGTPNKSANWNYPYNAYRGFITGNIQGNAYRQRNVFFYPPQSEEACIGDDSVQGDGTCGTNGNTKVFSADQNAEACSTNPELGGDISGLFAGFADTTTELVGDDNALLYQVFLSGSLIQSQLTTLTADGVTGQIRRTRSAQGFTNGVPSSMSFYRERKVEKEEFYTEMENTIAAYNILVPDTCTWMDNYDFTPGSPPIIETSLEPGVEGCRIHLEESFML